MSGSISGMGSSSAHKVSSLSSCVGDEVKLYELTESGDVGPQMDVTTVGADGKFQFSGLINKHVTVATANQNKTSYMLEFVCGTDIYRRFVTGAMNQDLSFGSTIVTWVTSTSGKANVVKNQSSVWETFYKNLDGADSMSAAFSLLTTQPDLKEKFTTELGVDPSILENAQPVIRSVSVPTTLTEESANPLSVVAQHWLPSYHVAYEWHWGSTVLATTANYSFTPNANSQGHYVLQLFVGRDDGSSHVDVTQPFVQKSFDIEIANTIPAQAPAMTLLSAADTNSTSVSVRLTTGAGMQNCRSFSKLALVEDSSVSLNLPPTDDSYYTIQCTQAFQQDLSFTLSGQEGDRVLQLWAKDASGNISATPVQVSVHYDITGPALAVTSPAANTNANSGVTLGGDCESGLTVTINGTGVIADTTTCTGGHFSKAVTFSSGEGSKSISVSQTDAAGNPGSASRSFVKDSVAPVLNFLAPAAGTPGITGVSISGTCEDGLTVSVSGDVTSDTVPCSSGFFSDTVVFTSGEGAKSVTVSQTDAASNPGSATRSFLHDSVPPVVTIGTPAANTMAVNGVTVSGTCETGLTVNFGGAGFNSASTSCSAGTYSQAVTFTSGDGDKILSVSQTDAAGNPGTTTRTFKRDSTGPSLTYLRINNDDPLTLSAVVNVQINADDGTGTAGVQSVRFANSTTSCQDAYADANWVAFTNGGGIQTYQTTVNFSNGLKKLCGWAKDALGNVSVISTNAGMGTAGVDTDTINLDMGTAPTFSNFTVINNTSTSPYYNTTNFNIGDQVKIDFTITDETELAAQPVSIQKTTDNVNYTEIASTSAVGDIGTGHATWTTTYTGYSATSTAYFRLRLVGKDSNGNTATLASTALNSGKWAIYAGSNDIGDGASAVSATLRMYSSYSTHNPVMMNSRNEMFISTRDGIRKVDPVTGVISTYLRVGTQTGIPGTVNSSTRLASGTPELMQDGDFAYIATNNHLYRINTLTNDIIQYAGGGTSNTTSDPSQMFVWDVAGMTIDPATKDLYIFQTCDTTVTGNSTTVSVKIQKITQDSTTKLASTVSDVAGNCVKGNIIDGAAALSTPLENSIYRDSGTALAWVSSQNTLYFATQSQRMAKLINGHVYTSDSASAMAVSLVYLPSEDKVYSVLSIGIGYSIWRFTPNGLNDFNETVTSYIGLDSNCADPSCRDPGKPVAQAGAFPGEVFRLGDQLGFVDGYRNNDGIGQLRLVDAATQTVQVLVGRERFKGDGKNRQVAQFGGLHRVIYKSQDVTNFPAGLYVGDGLAGRLLQIDPATDLVHVRAGSGIGKDPALGGINFDATTPVARLRLTYDLGLFTLNSLGLFTYYTDRFIVNVKADQTTEYLMGGSSTTTDIYMQPDGTTMTPVMGLCNDGGDIQYGIEYDPAGNLYFGGYQASCTPNSYNKIVRRGTDGKIYNIIGNLTVASSADCSTAGCAQSQSLGCTGSSGAGGCPLGAFDARYATGTGRLVFAENQKIRFVSDPTHPTNSTLGTLKKYDGTDFVAGRNIGKFVYRYVDPADTNNEAIDRVFYISSDGKLYCAKLSAGADSTCTNAPLGPNSPMDTLSSGAALTDSPTGQLYMVNGNLDLVLQYTP